MTRRDLQGVAKEMRRPWEAGKAFDHAAPCSAIVPAADIGHPDSGRIWLAVNGEIRQDGDLAQQIWSVPESIAHLTKLFELVPGDLIMTGTPAGVGSVNRGDKVTGGIDGIADIEITVV
jgi:fumarylpyruvate hydrolase